MNPLGIGIGLGLTQVFVENDPSTADGLQQIYNMNFFYAAVGTVIISPTFIFFTKKPPTPPRYSKIETFLNFSAAAGAVKYNFWEALRSMARNKTFRLFILGSGLFYGGFNVIPNALQPLLSSFGFTTVY